MPRAVIVSASESGLAALPAGFPERHCFSRQNRLLAAEQFAEVFSGRQVLRGPNFALHFLANDQAGPRLGLVIPKKQARTAVLRNAIKRQAREQFRKSRSRLPAVDVILRLARPLTGQKADAVSRAAWRAEIAVLFERLERKEAR